MNIEIIEKTEQPLLDRQLVKAALTFEGATPSRKDTIAALAKELKAKDDLVVVTTIRTIYGRTRALATVHLYKSADSAAKHEPQFLAKRLLGKQAPKAEATADGA